MGQNSPEDQADGRSRHKEHADKTWGRGAGSPRCIEESEARRKRWAGCQVNNQIGLGGLRVNMEDISKFWNKEPSGHRSKFNTKIYRILLDYFGPSHFVCYSLFCPRRYILQIVFSEIQIELQIDLLWRLNILKPAQFWHLWPFEKWIINRSTLLSLWFCFSSKNIIMLFLKFSINVRNCYHFDCWKYWREAVRNARFLWYF